MISGVELNMKGMPMAKKMIWILAFVLAASASPAFAGDFSVTARGGYFVPSDSVFRNIYGNGMSWGGELGFHITSRLEAWAGADYFSRTGKLAFTQEETRIRIVPLTAGLRYAFPISRLKPYVGLGIGYFRYKETNSIGKVEKGDFGYCGRIGVIISLGSSFFVDIQGNWTRCTVRPAGVKADLGGIQTVLGLGFEF
jgi:opacity protein-like surface antigen